MSNGWSGKILRVDLSNQTRTKEPTQPYTTQFIGGRGINAKIMFDEITPDIKPFDPENIVCFGIGTLTGTTSPTSSRVRVTTMSPAGLTNNSSFGGFFGPEVKWAGYDHIVIKGKSDQPVYLYIHNDEVEFRPAGHIWGKPTWEAQQVIRKEAGEDVKTVCIGPAGEQKVSFACLITNRTNVAGRGGTGAIMGSKNLKAIAVRGTRGINIARPKEFLAACRETHQWLKDHPRKDNLTVGDYGTTMWQKAAGQFFLGNWEDDVDWAEADKYVTGEDFWEKYQVHNYQCSGCPLAHSSLFHVPGIGLASSDCNGWVSYLPAVWNSDYKVAFHANHLCDQYGMDCISSSNIIGFLMDLYHRGIITQKDTDGIAMERGDAEAIIAAVHKLGRQEGFGKLFRDGIEKGARALGKEAEPYAMTVKGLELHQHEVRAFKSQALSQAIGTIDGMDDRAVLDADWPADKKELDRWAEKMYGFKGEVLHPMRYHKKAAVVWDTGNRICLSDMLGVCMWVTPYFIHPTYEPWLKLYLLATGIDATENEMIMAAERVKLLERAFYNTKGITRKDDTLPKRLFEVAVPGGIYKGEKLDRKKFQEMLNEYYELRGWDENGIITDKAFADLGMKAELKVFKQRMQSGSKAA